MKIELGYEWMISVISDIDENGNECFYVQAEHNDGRRLKHSVTFPTVSYNELGNEQNVKWSALKSCTSLAERVIDRGYISDSFWNETDPRYGSKEYQQRWK